MFVRLFLDESSGKIFLLESILFIILNYLFISDINNISIIISLGFMFIAFVDLRNLNKFIKKHKQKMNEMDIKYMKYDVATHYNNYRIMMNHYKNFKYTYKNKYKRDI